MAEVTERRRVALCCGCEQSLTEEPEFGTWHGKDDMPVCIPAQYGRPPILHMPMPEGFRGAPE